MENEYDDIAQRLRIAVKAHGVTDAEFARAAGITPKAFSNYVSGKYRVGLSAALQLRAAYGLPLDWLYCGGSVDKLPNKISIALSSSPRDTHSR